MYEAVCENPTEIVSRVDLTVGSAEVRSDFKPVLNTTDCEWESSSSMGEAHLHNMV